MSLFNTRIFKKVTNFTLAFALVISSVATIGSFIFSSEASAAPAAGTVTISGNTAAGENSPGWMFNRDVSTSTPFEFNQDEASIGSGALYVQPIGSTPANKFIAESFILSDIADISTISYAFKIGAGGSSADANDFYMNVYANFGNSSPTKFYDCRYNIIPTVGSTGGFTTVTFDTSSSYSVTRHASAPFATCPAVPNDMNTLSSGSTIRVFALNVGDTSASDTGLSGYLDNVTINSVNGVTVYDFESPTPSASQSAFVGSPKYVREFNYTTDIAAQVRVPNTATDVRFIVNGSEVTDTDYSNGANDNDIYTVNGAAAGSQWYRLQKSLPAGEYSILAEYKYFGGWFGVTGSGVAYSLDTPTGSYVIPNTTSNAFRPSDNPVRVKAEDQYNQFLKAEITIGTVKYTVLRADCDLRAAGNYVLCDVDQAATWGGLAPGTYTASTSIYTAANNRLDNLVSDSFIIDGTSPTIADLTVPSGVLGAAFAASATAEDTESGVESVNFYITEPRASDGACTGNGTKLYELRIEAGVGGVYTANFTTNLNGNYCVNAIARNHAFGNSVILRQAVVIDTTAPDVAITNPLDDDVINGSVGTPIDVRGTVTDANPHHYFVRVQRQTGPSTWTTVYSQTTNELNSFTDQTIYNWTPSVDGTYRITLEARDAAGGTSSSGNKDSGSVASITVVVDTTAPTLTIDPLTTTGNTPTITGTVDDTTAAVVITIDSVDYVATNNGDGTWTFTVTTPLDDGTYPIGVIATDTAGNESDVATADMTVDTAPAPTPPTDEETTTTDDGGDTLGTTTTVTPITPPIVSPAAVLGDTTDDGIDTTTDQSADTDVEGATTDVAVIDTDATDGSIFGLAWYWWLLILAALAAITSMIVAAVRRRNDEA